MTREVIIPYKSGHEVIELDGINKCIVAYPKDSTPKISSDDIIESFERPVDKPPLKEFLEHSNRLLVIVNDGTRQTATADILDLIYPHLERIDFKILIASGAHPEPKSAELKRILGENYTRLAERVVMHHSKRIEDMVYLGKSSRGTEFYINSLAVQSDRILVITSVEPHYFAGFMGGRKSFLPGISSYTTIVQNHRLALHPMARAFSLSRNPLNKDMWEIFEYLSPDKVFSIQLLQDRKGKVAKVLSGDIQKSFFPLTKAAREVYGAKIESRADILVSVVSNPSLSLYESRKAIHYGILGLRRGGILILVSPCTKGLGDTQFFEPILMSRTPGRLIDWIAKDFKLGWQRLAKWAEARLWGEIWLVSDLPDKTVMGTFLKPYHSVEIAIKEAIKLKGASSKIAFVFDGTSTVPLPQ